MDALLNTASIAGVGGIGCLIYVAITAMFRRRFDSARDNPHEQVRRTRLIATFTVRDRQEDVITLFRYQQYMDAGAYDNPTAERRGATHILTSDGRRVDKIGTGKYRVLGSSGILTSDDPSAP